MTDCISIYKIVYMNKIVYIYGQAVDNGIITFIASAALSASSHGPCGVLPGKLETVVPVLFVQVLEDVHAFGRP